MVSNLRKYLALAAAVTLTAALGTGCSGQKANDAGPANVKVAVSTQALQSDIGSIQLTIDGQPDSPGAPGFPIVTLLSKDPGAGNVWTGNVTGIPANAAGLKRTFTAIAYQGPNATGAQLYQGSTVATVVAAQTAQVTIMLQELNATPGPQNYAPVIAAVNATNSYVLPGTAGSFSVTAYDPDDAAHFNRPQFAGTLAYQWSATCDNGTLSLATPNAATTAFVAPSVTNALCTVNIKVSETGLANNSSVTTYFTLTVNGNFGSAVVFGFPNSYPIVTVRGDFRYNFFSDVTTVPVGQQGDLFFTTVDPDGDDVRFDLTGACGTGFSATDGSLQGGVALAANQFSAVTLTTTRGGPVAPPTQSPAFAFNPTFAYPTPVVAFTDPTKSCQFKIVVSDLCTAGNCGAAGAQGSKANGADKGGVTIGFLNATAPSQAKRAPSIARVNVPNQNGVASPGAQSWDPQKYVVVAPNSAYSLSIDAEDTYEGGPLTISTNCNAGIPATVSTSAPGGQKTLHWVGSWTSPATLVSDMNCVYTVASASGLSTPVTVRFVGTDPCIGVGNGVACTHSNKCVTSATCQNSVCTPAVTTTCSALDQCHVAGVCNPNTGVCSNPNATDGSSCNFDSNGCTAGDSCQAGLCTVGAAAQCTTPPNAFCFAGTGACSSTGNNTFNCNYSATPGVVCTVGQAAAKCNGANTFTGFACDATGACVGSGAQACANTTCASGNTCQAATGACGGGSFQPVTTTCDDGNLCTTGDHCNGAGACVGGGPLCPVGQSCNAGTCVATKLVPTLAADARLTPPGNVAMDTAGNTYLAGSFTGGPFNFGTLSATAGGGMDMFVAKYDTAGTAQYLATVQDDTAAALTDQTITGVAVTKSGKVGVIGKIAGAVTFPNGTVSNANPTPIVAAFTDTGTSLTRAWANMYNLGGGLFLAVAANPNQALNRIAACGQADTGATTLDGAAPAAGFGQLDAVIGAWDSATGTKLWGRQIGTAGNETCAAVTVDSSGNVIASGQFDGANIDLGNGFVLAGPNTATRKFMWIAKFDGATGTTLAAQVFSGTLGNAVPRGLAVSPTGDIGIAGSFTGNLTIGAAMTTAGSEDAFVALVHPDFTPAWNAVRIGGTAADLLRSIAFTSFGDIVAVGNFTASSAAFRTANGGFDTSGGAGLLSAGAADAMVVKFSGLTGATDGAASYGNAVTQSGDSVAVNAFGANQSVFTLSSAGTLTFAPGVTFTATGSNDVALVFGNLQ